MGPGRHTPEQVINKPRDAEVAMAAGSTVAEASCHISVTEQYQKSYDTIRPHHSLGYRAACTGDGAALVDHALDCVGRRRAHSQPHRRIGSLGQSHWVARTRGEGSAVRRLRSRRHDICWRCARRGLSAWGSAVWSRGSAPSRYCSESHLGQTHQLRLVG